MKRRLALVVLLLAIGAAVIAASEHAEHVSAGERAYQREVEDSATAAAESTSTTTSTTTTQSPRPRLTDAQWEELGSDADKVFLLWQPEGGPVQFLRGINATCQDQRACNERQGTELLELSDEAVSAIEAAKATVTRPCRRALGILYAAMYNYGQLAEEIAHGTSTSNLTMWEEIKSEDETVLASGILASHVTETEPAASILFGSRLATCRPTA
ncbi:MAG: hypothetical protein WBW93_14440 [Steroidobacteraceae bacterium]